MLKKLVKHNVLNGNRKTWSSVSSMRIERILPGIAAMDGLIYVIGGEQESKILANGEVFYMKVFFSFNLM